MTQKEGVTAIPDGSAYQNPIIYTNSHFLHCNPATPMNCI